MIEGRRQTLTPPAPAPVARERGSPAHQNSATAVQWSSPSPAERERGPGGEGHWPPLPLRRRAATLLGEVGDPRLLDPQHGDAPLGGYWCAIDAGPFWFGDDREGALRQMTLPYPYRIGRYPVTNAEYGRFIDARGYQERRWWTDNWWAYSQRQSWTEPRLWNNAERNQPTQPVVGVTWWECAAYCAWLTAQGQAVGWLATSDAIRLPTSLEWERAARGTDQRRYPWGDEPPDAERANYRDTGIGQPTAVGCFPAGAATCGALDLAGNVMEWMSTPFNAQAQVGSQKDFTAGELVLLSYGWYNGNLEQLSCGARCRYNPFVRDFGWAFRVVWSRALAE